MRNLFDKLKLGKIPIHLVIIGILGLIFLLLGNPMGEDEEKAEKHPAQDTPERDMYERDTYEREEINYVQSKKSLYRRELENDLSRLLSFIQGVGKVDVMVQLEGGRKLEIAEQTMVDETTTTETDTGGGERVIEEKYMEEEIIMTRQQGEDKPVVLRELKPEIKGIFIVAEGGENLKIKKEIKEAVHGFMGVPFHNIKVLPRE